MDLISQGHKIGTETATRTKNKVKSCRIEGGNEHGEGKETAEPHKTMGTKGSRSKTAIFRVEQRSQRKKVKQISIFFWLLKNSFLSNFS
jgi:hypothetical protein